MRSLVEQQKPWTDHDRARQRDALPLAAGELRRQPRPEVGQAHGGQRGTHAFADLRRRALAQLEAEGDVVERREVREERV